MPEVITGLSLLIFFISLKELIGWPLERGFTTITIAHITFSLAYVAVIVQARLTGMGISLEEAARSLGASKFWAVWYITLPIISPGLIAGAIFSFIISFDEFIITFFLATFQRTLPLEMFSTLMYQVKPSIAAVSALTLAITAILTVVLMFRGQVVGGGKIIK